MMDVLGDLLTASALAELEKDIGGLPVFNGENARHVMDCAAMYVVWASRHLSVEVRQEVLKAYKSIYGEPPPRES